MVHELSYEHNTEYNRSTIRALHSKIIYLEPIDNYANLVIKNNEIIQTVA